MQISSRSERCEKCNLSPEHKVFFIIDVVEMARSHFPRMFRRNGKIQVKCVDQIYKRPFLAMLHEIVNVKSQE